jgi:hypothetical protein
VAGSKDNTFEPDKPKRRQLNAGQRRALKSASVNVFAKIDGTGIGFRHRQGRLMHWFRKTRQPDVWEVADAKPVGDIEAAQKIREICASASTIAGKMAAEGRRADKGKTAEAERPQTAIKRALAMKISDDAMRDVSVGQIIGLCVMVNHMKTARILVRAIKSENTRAELIHGNPALADRWAATE